MPEPPPANPLASTGAGAGVSVAIPVLNGGQLLERVLDALARQTVVHELVVCDSGSSDGSAALARARGAEVFELAREHFGHGHVRNLLMSRSQGAHVAFLTQDAEPADERWLERLLGGFSLAGDVAVTYGPYLPRSDASLPVRLELEAWFGGLAGGGETRVERLEPHERDQPASRLMGARGFLTDANACLSRGAWEQVPFREAAYAEDRALAIELLRHGYAKAFVAQAAVVHSHEYGSLEHLRRCFDEWRGLLEVYGWREPARPAHLAGQLRGALGQARRELATAPIGRRARAQALMAVARHHSTRLLGAMLGSRADRLSPTVRGLLSLERRSSFVPLELAAAPPPAGKSNDPR
jgi:rhamnosyltransferase